MRLWAWIYLCWVTQSVKPRNVTRNKCTFFPVSWSMCWWWRSLFAQVVCRTNQEYINYISFSELWFHETDMNGYFPERQYECWMQKMIRWKSWQYTLHDSITSVVHRQVNVLCSECGVFLVKSSVTVMSSSCSLDEFICCQIRAMVSDIGTLTKFPWECCVRFRELAQIALFCSFSLGMMRSG